MSGDGLTGRARPLALVAVYSALILSVLSQFSVSVALPVIAVQLQASASDAVLIVTVFQLVLVSTLFPFASLGEKLGYRRVFLPGMATVGVGLVVAALSSTLEQLVVGRLLQALGASAVMSVNLALIRTIVPAAQLGRSIGFNAMVVALTTALAPSVTSLVLSLADWHWIFLVNLLWVALGLAFGAAALPRDTATATAPYDWLGALLCVLAFCLVFGGLELVLSRPLAAAALVAAGGASGLLLVRRQWHQASPLLPLDLLRIRQVAYPAVTSVGMFAAQMAALVGLPFQLHDVLGKSMAQTGAIMTVWPIAVAIMAPLTGWLDRRIDTALLCMFGAAVFSASLLAIALLPASVGLVPIGLAMAGCGIGFGCFQSPNVRAMLAATPRHRSASAGGLQSMGRLSGQTLGTTVAGLCFFAWPGEPGRACVAVLLIAATCALAASAVCALRKIREARTGPQD